MMWPWRKKPEPKRHELLMSRIMDSVCELERKLEQLSTEKTIFLGAQPAVTKLPDDWPQTVAAVARHERRIDALQQEVAQLRASVTAGVARRRKRA